jgi:threonine/homoserine/homoserine lactone efflux protein
MLGHLVAFFGVSLVVIVTPGPDTALTVRNALLGNRRSGIATAVGVVSGQGMWALLSAAGLASLLERSQPAFETVRLAGAGYLIYLGVRALAGAVRHRRPDPWDSHCEALTMRPRTAYRQGLISNLANPKMVVFFLSLLPQFTGAHASFVTLLALGVLFCALTFVWLSAYAAAVAKAGGFLRRPRIRGLIDGLTGLVLVTIGVRLASQSR